MNLERLRKRVRQYLDQVGSAAGGPVRTAGWPEALVWGEPRREDAAPARSAAGRGQPGAG